MRDEQIIRCLKVMSYLSPNYPVTGDDLAEECGASSRQIRRDIDLMREAGIQIESGPDGYSAPDLDNIKKVLGIEDGSADDGDG